MVEVAVASIDHLEQVLQYPHVVEHHLRVAVEQCLQLASADDAHLRHVAVETIGEVGQNSPSKAKPVQ